MDDIISTRILPEVLCRRIRGDKVRVFEANGVISLIPLDSPDKNATPVADGLVGLLKDAGLKNSEDVKNMRLDV
jgi:hypothetical protein